MAAPGFGLWFRRYAPFDEFGFGFEGDHRAEASTSFKDTSRTYGCVLFNQFQIINQFANTSGTHRHTILFGEIVGFAKVAMTVVRATISGPGLIGFTAHTAGRMPLSPEAVTPDIDTYVKMQFSFGMNSLRVTGEAFGDNFPNLEVFLHCYPSKRSALLLDGRTTGGKNTGPLARLSGTHSNHSLGLMNAILPLNNKRELDADYRTGATTMGEYPRPEPVERGFKV